MPLIWLGLSVAVGVALLAIPAFAGSEALATPPCTANPPFPAYTGLGAEPAIKVWTRRASSPSWVPPSCTGWTKKGEGVLVALAARFRYGGKSETLMLRFGAISKFTGIRYWSATEGGWRTLITEATALAGPDVADRRPDFSLAEMRSGKDLLFAQSDNRAAGEVIYRMRVRETSPTRFVVAIDNLSAVRRFMLTLFEPGDLQSLHFLEQESSSAWRYYGLAWATGTAPARLAVPEASYLNRAVALFRHFAGSPDPSKRQP